jgi:hypothetical protein
MHRSLSTVLLLVAACAPEYEDVPVKLVGVGYNPEEVGPSPTPYGGVLEYSLVNFTGAGLSLAMMSLGSFVEMNPDNLGAKAPYRAVYGFSYMFDTKLSAADSLGGITSVPPDVEETCYTTFEATGPIGSFTTVDVGSYMDFRSSDGKGGFRLDRLPADYPANAQDMFIYYSSFDTWQSAPFPEDRGQENYQVLRKANFPLGQSMEFSFPGALAPAEAPVSSLPQPSEAVGNTVFTLPNDLGPVMLSWDGPRVDSFGAAVLDGSGNPIPDGPQATCLSFSASENAPTAPEECAGGGGLGSEGQTYIGPWDTADGTVTFKWVPNTNNPNEIVSLAVRFLGSIDEETDPNYMIRAVPDNGATGDEPPVAAYPCQEGEWVFDEATYTNAQGDISPALQGDPFHNLAELTCRLADDGEFVLTEEMLLEAYTYAQRYGAEGAVFYLARSTEAEIVVPPVMNSYEQKLEISPVKLTSRVIDIGRFWYDGGAQ